MENRGGRASFSVGMDTDDLKKGAEEVRKEFQEIAKEANKADKAIGEIEQEAKDAGKGLEKLKEEAKQTSKPIQQVGREAKSSSRDLDEMGRTSEKLSATMRKAGGLIAGALSTKALIDFSREVINVRTEIDSLERSFAVLTGSAENGQKLVDFIKEFAATTPLSIQGLSKAAQTMLSFGVEGEKVTKMLSVLGDISMGNAESMNSLALAYSQMVSTGKLMGQDLLQMINAGFNPLNEIAKNTGKSIGELKENLADIPLEEVERAFISATEAGGKFYGMLESQAQGLAGVQASFRDAVMTSMNELGAKYEDVIKGAINGATELVSNLDEVVPVVMEIIAVYGTYRAALIAVMAVEKAMIALKQTQITTTNLLAVAQKNLNAVMAKNKYAIIAGLIAGLAYGIYKFTQRTDEAKKAQEDLNEAMRVASERVEEQRSKSEELLNTIRDGNETNYARQKAYETLIGIYPELIGKIDLEKLKTMELTEAIRLLNEERDKSVVKEYEDKARRLEAELFKLETQGDGKFTFGDVKQAFGGVNDQEQNAIKAKRDELAQVQALITATKEEQRVSKLSTEERIKELEKRKEANARYIEDYKKQIDDLTSEDSFELYGELTEKDIKRIEHLQSSIQEFHDDISAVDAQIEELSRKPVKVDGTGKASEPKVQTSTKDYSREIARALENVQREHNALIIDLLDEGMMKELAKADEVHSIKLQSIDRQKAELIEARREMGRALTEEELELFDALREATTQAYRAQVESITEQERAKNEAVLSEYEDYFTKRANILKNAEEEEERIRQAAQALGIDPTPSLDVLMEQTEEALNILDKQTAEKDASFRAWASAMVDFSIQELRTKLALARAELTKLEKQGSKDAKEIAKARAEVSKMEQTLANKEAESAYSPDEEAVEDWKELYKVLDIASQGFERMGEEIGGVAGSILKDIGQISSATITIITGIRTLVDASITGIVEGGKAGAKAIGTVEKATVILTIISAVLQVAMKIASLFDRDKSYEEEIQGLQRRIDQLQWELENTESLSIAKELGEPYELIADSLERAKLSQEEIVRLVGRHRDELMEMNSLLRDFYIWQIQRDELLNKAGSHLADTYAKLDYTVTNVLGEERYKNVRRELENIAKQNILLAKQAEAESSKKKSDGDKIQEYQQKQLENTARMAQLLNDALEDIMGGSARAIAEDLGDALIDAFAKGEDAAKAWGDKVDDIVRDIMKRMLITELVEKPLGEIFNQYKKEWFGKNGEFKGVDAVVNSLPALSDELMGAGEGLMGALKSLDPVLNSLLMTSEALDKAGEDDRRASSKGLASMSQDTGDEIAGRATAIQGHTYVIAQNSEILTRNSNAILQHVASIDDNTDRLRAIERDMKGVKETLQTGTIKVKM